MLFSVIVPFYKVEKYAAERIESILAQTYADFEVILVNDGSPDRTKDIIDYYANKDSRVIAVHKANGGLVSARKAGAALAKGEYIVTVDGDDWLERTALEKVANALERFDSDIVCYGFFNSISKDNRSAVILTEKEVYFDQWKIKEELVPHFFCVSEENTLYPNLWNKVIRRSLYMKYGELVDNRISMGEDGAVTYPCVYEAKHICVLPEALYNYRQNPKSMTRDKNKYLTWEMSDLRIDHFLRVFEQADDVQKLISNFVVHSYFNVIISHLKNEPYTKVKNESIEKLKNPRIRLLIDSCSCNGDKKLALAQTALARGWIWLLKIYAMIS